MQITSKCRCNHSQPFGGVAQFQGDFSRERIYLRSWSRTRGVPDETTVRFHRRECLAEDRPRRVVGAQKQDVVGLHHFDLDLLVRFGAQPFPPQQLNSRNSINSSTESARGR